MLQQFLSYYWPHTKLLLLDFGCAAVPGVLELGFPMAVRAFINHLLPQGDLHLIILAIMALLAAYVMNGALTAVINYWGHVLGISIETELRRRAFNHLQRLSFRFSDNQKTGHLVSRLTTDLVDIGEVAPTSYLVMQPIAWRRKDGGVAQGWMGDGDGGPGLQLGGRGAR